MGEPDRLFLSRPPGVKLAAVLALTISCSTVDKVKTDLPPSGTSPSGAELVTDEQQEPGQPAGEDNEKDDFYDLEEPAFEDETDVADLESEPEQIDDETDDFYDLGGSAFEDETDVADLESEPEQSDDESLVVIDTGAKDLTERPHTLAEAAQAERKRRNLGPPTDIVITDKTLAEYATGDLTVADTSNNLAADDASALTELESEMAAKEAYWRQTARDIRQGWRDAYDSIEELEAKVFDLRQQFYREDDGFYRDAEIKPAWDRAIDQLEEARLEVEAKQQELEEFLEAGREAGALPGWLREGIELEPKPIVKNDAIAEPTEPVIYQPETSDPP